MIDPIARAYRHIIKPVIAKVIPVTKEKLPALYDGKYEEPDGNDLPSYYRKPEKTTDQIQEEFEDIKTPPLDDYNKAEYHKKLERNHEMTPLAGTQAEDADKAVYDLLKTPPTVDKYMAAMHIINKHPYASDGSDVVLRHKYSFVHSHMISDEGDYSPEEKFLSHDEILKHKDDYTFYRGRKLIHKNTGLVMVLHPDGTKTFTGSHYDEGPLRKPIEEIRELNNKLEELHSQHIENHTSFSGAKFKLHVTKYTGDSRELNTFLAKQYHGEEFNDAFRRESDEDLEAHSNALSDGIKHSAPLKEPMTVYSGLSHMTKLVSRSEGCTKAVDFHAPTFISTSINPKTAEGFAKDKIHPSKATNPTATNVEGNEFDHNGPIADLMAVDLPAGFRGGTYVESHTSNGGETEYILDKDHQFHFHPHPKYMSSDKRLIRVWKATVKPKNYDNE